MRILAITNSRIPSLTANSIQAMKVCDALSGLGHEVTLLAPRETKPASWGELSRHYGLRHEFSVNRQLSIRALKRLDFVWSAQAVAGRLKPDLIYTWLPQSAVLALWRNYPVVLEMHADVAGLFGPWWLRQFWAARGRKRLLVTTRALKSALERSTGVDFPDDALQVAPNGVDLERYAHLPEPSQARRELGLPACPTAGFTGHFYKGRGMELLLELALAQPKVHFLWVGGTPEAVAEWRLKLTASQVSNVTLTGFVENSQLPLYQAAAEVLLMPYSASISASSGQDIAEVINPMKMFEYMAAGRAIISADIPSIHEVLDESTAVFCVPGDAAAWKNALTSLLADDARRALLAGHGLQTVQSRTWIAREQKALAGLR